MIREPHCRPWAAVYGAAGLGACTSTSITGAIGGTASTDRIRQFNVDQFGRRRGGQRYQFRSRRLQDERYLTHEQLCCTG